MLSIPASHGKQRLSIEDRGIIGSYQRISIWSKVPPGTKVTLRSGDLSKGYCDIPAINFSLLDEYGHPLDDKERQELVDLASITFDNNASRYDKIEFSLIYRDVLLGKNPAWQLKEIAFGIGTMVFCFYNGDHREEIVVNGFKGRIAFDVPMAWDQQTIRRVELDTYHDGKTHLESYLPGKGIVSPIFYWHPGDEHKPWEDATRRCVQENMEYLKFYGYYARLGVVLTEFEVERNYLVSNVVDGVEITHGTLEQLLQEGRNGCYNIIL